MVEKRTELGRAIELALQEAIAWKRGEADLHVDVIEPMPKERVRSIRKGVARSTKAFETRFGIPAATISNWEQGRRRPGPSDRLLLEVIARDPTLVEDVAKAVDATANENHFQERSHQKRR